jgi:hypothetical protein
MGGGAVPVAHSKVNIDPSTRLRKASKCRNGFIAVEPSAVEHTDTQVLNSGPVTQPLWKIPAHLSATLCTLLPTR